MHSCALPGGRRASAVLSKLQMMSPHLPGQQSGSPLSLSLSLSLHSSLSPGLQSKIALSPCDNYRPVTIFCPCPEVVIISDILCKFTPLSMTSAKSPDCLTLSPLVMYRIQATSFRLSAFWGPPSLQHPLWMRTSNPPTAEADVI